MWFSLWRQSFIGLMFVNYMSVKNPPVILLANTSVKPPKLSAGWGMGEEGVQAVHERVRTRLVPGTGIRWASLDNYSRFLIAQNSIRLNCGLGSRTSRVPGRRETSTGRFVNAIPSLLVDSTKYVLTIALTGRLLYIRTTLRLGQGNVCARMVSE